MMTATLPRSVRGSTLRQTPAWTRRDYAVLGGVGLLVGLLRAESPVDSDVLWSARYGMDVISSGRLPRSDAYSWSGVGKSWVPNSWGWNVVLGACYRMAHELGLYLVVIAVAVALALVVGRAASRIGAQPLQTAMIFVLLAPFALLVDPRGQTVGYLLMFSLPALLAPMLYGSRGQAIRAATCACAVQVLWMNLHTSAVLGPVMLAVGGIGLLVGRDQAAEERSRAIRRLLVIVVLTTASCLATPYGAAPILHIQAVRRASVGLINEWEPAGFGNLGQILALAAIVLAGVVAWLAWRARRIDTVGILILLACATASAIRFAPMLLVFVMPELAAVLGKLNVRPHMVRRTLALGCATLAVLMASRLGHFASVSASQTSRQLVAAIPRDCRLVNDYTIGDAVILYRPDVKVSLDGRNDVYGRDLVIAMARLLGNAPGTTGRLESAHVDCVLAYTGYGLVTALSRDPNWRIVRSDSVRTLLVRVTP